MGWGMWIRDRWGIVGLGARFDAEGEATSQASTRVVDALLSTTTSAQAGKNNALLLAAAHDSLAPLAGRLIAGGAEVDAARPSSGSTPLYIACDHGNVVMVARLIESTMRPLVAARRCSSQLRTIDWMF